MPGDRVCVWRRLSKIDLLVQDSRHDAASSTPYGLSEPHIQLMRAESRDCREEDEGCALHLI